MRVTVAVLMAISVLFVGVFALSEGAQQTEPSLNSTAANDSYSLANEVYGGILGSAGPGIVWFGIAAIIVVALGYLVIAGRSGR